MEKTKMPMTATQAQQLYVAYFNRPADTLGLAYWMTKDAAAASAAFASSAEYAATYAGMSTVARVDAIYNNLFGRPAEPAGLTYWGLLIEQGRISISDAVTQIAGGAQGTDKVAYNNKVTAASAFTTALDTSAEIVGYSGTAANNAAKAWLTGVTTDATLAAATTTTALNASIATAVASGGSGAEGAVLALTSGTDAFSATASAATSKTTAGNDTINGVVQAAGATGTTIAPGDSIDGGAGVDTLNISVAGNAAAAFTLSAIQTNSVEKVLLSNFDTDAANATTVAADLMTGLQTVGFASSSADGDTIFSGLKNLVGAEMRNGSADLTLTYNASVVEGTADTQNLTVSNLSAGTFTANGAETIAITSELVKSSVSVAGDALKTVTTAGAADLTISNSLTATTVDASAMTGALSVKLGVANQTITGGKGNDTFDFQASTTLTSSDTVKGGDGTDTLKLSVAAVTVAVGTSATKGALFNVSGVEVVDVASTNDAATLDLDATSGITNVVAASNVGLFGVVGTTETLNDVVNFVLNGVSYTSGATTVGGAAATDTYEEVVAAKINTLAGFSAVAGADTVTITNTSGSSEAVEFGTMTITGTGTVAATGTTGYTNVALTNLAAGQVVDIFSADAVTASLKDASGTADVLNINLKTLSADKGFDHSVGTVTASNIETINLSANGMTDVKVTTIGSLAIASAKTLNITGDSDVTISALSAAALVTIDGSTSSGDLNLAAVTAAKDQSIKTGSGNDTIAMGAFLTNADTIDGGANNTPTGGSSVGVDTLTATVTGLTAVTGALNISNVERVNLTNAGTAVIDATKIVGASEIGLTTGGTSTTISGLASGAKIGVGFNGVADGGTAYGTVTASLTDATGSADSLTLNLNDKTDADINTVTLKTTGIETVNFAYSTASTATALASLTVTSTDLTAATVNVTGSDNDTDNTVTFGTLNAATTSVDASTFKGAVSLTAASAITVKAGGLVANAITGSDFADTITIGSNTATVAHTIAGGTGVDTLNMTLKTGNQSLANVSAVEAINLTIEGGAAVAMTSVAGIEDAALQTLSITGGDSLSTFTNTADTIAATTALTKIDMSGFVGAASLFFADDTLTTANVITGGANTKDNVNVIISNSANVYRMSGIETLNVTNGTGASSIDLANATGLKTVALNDLPTGTGNVTLTGYDTANTKLTLGKGVDGGAGITTDVDNVTVIVTGANVSGAADAISVTVQNVQATAGLQVNGIETVNLAIASDTAAAQALNLANVNATNKFVVNVTGGTAAQGFTLNSLATDATAVNASTFIGNLTLTGAARVGTTAMTITAGDGVDSLAMKNSADVMDGGGGTNDTLTITQSAILGGFQVDLSSTSDQVTTYNGSANSAVQKNFENIDLSGVSGSFGSDITGSKAANTIVGTRNVDQITAGAGNDVITGGAGADRIDGGTGNDQFIQATILDSGLLTAGAGVTSTSALDVYVVNAGDTILLAVDTVGTLDTLTAIAETGNLSNTVTAANVQQTRGIYDAVAQTFTVASVAGGANAVLINYDDNVAGTAAAQSIVLVGVTALTSVTDALLTV